MQVGSIVELKKAVLGNQSGIRGVCYEEYKIGEKPGYSIVFENGEYDGFSADEQKEFLKEIGINQETAGYKFVNVLQMSEDFVTGFFDEAFKRVGG